MLCSDNPDEIDDALIAKVPNVISETSPEDIHLHHLHLSGLDRVLVTRNALNDEPSRSQDSGRDPVYLHI